MVLSKELKTLSLKELFKSLRSIRYEWKYRTPYQKFCYLYSIGKIAFGLIGIPLFQEDRTLHWYSYFGYIYFGIYTILAIYTAIFYILRGESSKCLNCTCLLIGPLLSVSSINSFIKISIEKDIILSE